MNQQQMMAEMAKQQAGVTSQPSTAQPETVLKNPGYDPAADAYNPKSWGSDPGSLGKAYDQQFVNNAKFESNLSQLGMTPSDFGASWNQTLANNPISNLFTTIDLGPFGGQMTVVSAPEMSPIPSWGSPGWGGTYTPGASYPSFGSYGSGGYYNPSATNWGSQTTGFGGGVSMPTYSNGQNTFASPYIGNTSAVVWGAGANPDLSSAQVMMAQSQAQLQAQANSNAPGSISNYLEGNQAWETKSFGEWVSEGVQNAGEQVQNAWDGAVSGIQEAFAPSAFDSTAGSNVSGLQPDGGSGAATPRGAQGTTITGNAGADVLNGSDENQLPPVVVEQATPELPNYAKGLTDSGALKPANPQTRGLDGQDFSQFGGDKASPFDIGIEVVGGKPDGVVDTGAARTSPFAGLDNLNSEGFRATGLNNSDFQTAGIRGSPGGIMNQANPNAGTAGGTVPPPVNVDGAGRQSVSTGRSGDGGGGNSAPAPSASSGGGMGGIGQMLSSLMGMLKGGGGGGSGGGNSQPKLPPVTAASNSVLQTPVPSTQFLPPKPLTAAPQVSVVANPDEIASGAQSVISWSAQWGTAASSTAGECAVIDATGTTLVANASSTSSYQTSALTRSAYYIVGCKQAGGKLGSGVVLVKVTGDTQGPVPLPAGLGAYQSTTGTSDPAADLAAAVRPTATQPQQAVEVACDPNSSSYFDCLTGKMKFVDKLY